LAIVPLLLWKRTRGAAFAAMLMFHGINHFLFGEGFGLGVFPLLGILLSTSFLAPEWPRRFLPGKWFEDGEENTRGSGPCCCPRVVATFVAVWILVQSTVPFRHYLYPGNVNWTWQGHQFSWRMRLLNTETGMTLHVKARDGSFEQLVQRGELMELWRYDRVAREPDLILQTAHQVGEEIQEATGREVEVYAYSIASLNRRPWAWLIDPSVDLMRVERSIGGVAGIVVPLDFQWQAGTKGVEEGPAWSEFRPAEFKGN
jgi:vitamin K-dependent gamma-carboxylase